MQQRQLRLGDILDDYCPRERRLTNHAVVAMVGPDVKQTRCTTCDTEHEYRHAKLPRQRRKATPAALYSHVLASAPKRVVHDVPPEETASGREGPLEAPPAAEPDVEALVGDDTEQPLTREDEEADADTLALAGVTAEADEPESGEDQQREEGPVHRPLIRASLPRPEGQAPTARPGPDFTIRQPGGRAGRFRARYQRGAQPFQRSNGGVSGGPLRGSAPRPGGRPAPSRSAKRHGPGRKRSK